MTSFVSNPAIGSTPADGRSDRRTGGSGKWPAIVVGMLLAHAAIWIGVVFIARSNATFAVEPNYYQKALHWNDTAAQAGVNRRLAWRLNWTVAANVGHDASRRVTATLLNVDQAPLDGATIDVEMFSHRRGLERRRLSLTPEGQGLYSVDVPGMQPGVWELRAEVKRGPETFTSTQQLTLVG